MDYIKNTELKELTRDQYMRIVSLENAVAYNSGRGTPRQEVLRDAVVFENYINYGSLPS